MWSTCMISMEKTRQGEVGILALGEQFIAVPN